MPATEKSYGSEYLYSEDLLTKQAYHSVEVEIVAVHEPGTLKTKDGKTIENKWTIEVKGKTAKAPKKLPLCKTSHRVIHAVTGETAGPGWIGKTIRLEVRIVDSFGDKVPALRVMPYPGTMVPKSVLKLLGTKAVWNPPTEAK